MLAFVNISCLFLNKPVLAIDQLMSQSSVNLTQYIFLRKTAMPKAFMPPFSMRKVEQGTKRSPNWKVEVIIFKWDLLVLLCCCWSWRSALSRHTAPDPAANFSVAAPAFHLSYWATWVCFCHLQTLVKVFSLLEERGVCLPGSCVGVSRLTDGALSSICSPDTSWEGRAWMESSSPAKSCTTLFTAL